MRTVYKYALDFSCEIPQGAKLVHVGKDPNNVFCAWFEVETENPTATVTFHMVGTGNQIPPGAQHIASLVGDPFVWHIYAEGLK